MKIGDQVYLSWDHLCKPGEWGNRCCLRLQTGRVVSKLEKEMRLRKIGIRTKRSRTRIPPHVSFLARTGLWFGIWEQVEVNWNPEFSSNEILQGFSRLLPDTFRK